MQYRMLPQLFSLAESVCIFDVFHISFRMMCDTAVRTKYILVIFDSPTGARYHSIHISSPLVEYVSNTVQVLMLCCRWIFPHLIPLLITTTGMLYIQCARMQMKAQIRKTNAWPK